MPPTTASNNAARAAKHVEASVKMLPCDSCDTTTPKCKRCAKNGEICHRGTRKIKFRQGSRAKYDLTFSDDQVWLVSNLQSEERKFVDQTADVIAAYVNGQELDHEDALDSDTSAGRPARNDVALDRVLATQNHNHGLTYVESPSKVLKLDQTLSSNTSPNLETFTTSRSRQDLHLNSTLVLETNPNPDQQKNLDRSIKESLVPGTGISSADLEVYDTLYDGLVKRPSTYPGPKTHLEAILLRYFVEELARKFDLCDPERHFTQVVPQRARSSAPLLKAILTTSCRHLIRLRRHRHQTGMVEWQGNILDELNEDTAVYYHNECIRELLRLSMDPEQIHNETLLAAAIILRTDEEMQAPLSDEDGDKEIFLKMLNLFLEAQIPPVVDLPHSSPQIYFPDSPWDNTVGESPLLEPSTSHHVSHMSPSEKPTNPTYLIPRVPQSLGLRQACFWVALRQEIFTSFMKQRALKFPLSRCGAFRSFSLAEDAVWADRLVICCADVLEYCYGSIESDLAPDRSARRWEELRSQEKELTKYLPNSFEPTYYKAADKESGEVFPKVWYSDDSNVTGTTHLELARILLAVFNPTRPRLGPRAVAGMKDLALQLRNIVLRICGIALSHPMLPSVFNEALMSIVTCGEYFEDREEQEALLRVLDFMRDEHALPIGRVTARLQEAWAWE